MRRRAREGLRVGAVLAVFPGDGSGRAEADPRLSALAPDQTPVEMLRRADIVVPTFDGRLRLVKPSLIHWLQMPLFSLFGPVECAARLHALAATLGSLGLLVWVVRRRFGGEGAFWSAACFATLPLVVVTGKLVTLDALLSVHIFAATALDLAGKNGPAAARARQSARSWGSRFWPRVPSGLCFRFS